MSRNGVLALAAGLIMLVAAVGVGFAVVYTATTTSSNNTLNYGGNVLDIQNSNGASLGTSIGISGPESYPIGNNQIRISGGTPVWTNTYLLKVDTAVQGDTLDVRCWITLKDPRSWAIIDSFYIEIYEGNVTHTIDFVTSNDLHTLKNSSLLSDSIPLSAGTYAFAICIQYADLTLDLSGMDTDTSFLNLTGSKLTFVSGTSDPVPSPEP